MAGVSAGGEPIADVHLHYNWDQAELLSAAEAAERLDRLGIRLGIVSGVPAGLARQLAEAAPGRVYALFSPYLEPSSRWMWHARSELLDEAEAALASGQYIGLGEMHLQPGIGPRRDHPVFLGLLALAEQYRVPVLIHTDASSETYLTDICLAHPAVRFLWAHAGGILSAEQVKRALKACQNLWIELSARDPWRYDSLAERDGALPAAWRDLILEYPDRVMIGSDPVWNVTRGQSWETADEGWDYLDMLWDYHRRWLGTLPPALQRRLLWDNAATFFKLP